LILRRLIVGDDTPDEIDIQDGKLVGDQWQRMFPEKRGQPRHDWRRAGFPHGLRQL